MEVIEKVVVQGFLRGGDEAEEEPLGTFSMKTSEGIFGQHRLLIGQYSFAIGEPMEEIALFFVFGEVHSGNTGKRVAEDVEVAAAFIIEKPAGTGETVLGRVQLMTISTGGGDDDFNSLCVFYIMADPGVLEFLVGITIVGGIGSDAAPITEDVAELDRTRVFRDLC